MFKKIVVGCTEGQAGRDAVCLAAKLATLFDSEWTVVYPYQLLLSSVPALIVEQRIREDVETFTAGIDGLRAPRYHGTPSSWPVHALHEMAVYERADLIVFGSPRGEFAERVHVSLMDRVVHGAPCAVAVAPARYADSGPGEFRRVGVGFASSPEGIAALHVGWALAERSGGELDVIAGCALEPGIADGGSAPETHAEVEREILEPTDRALRRVCAELGDAVEVKWETATGQAADVLLERSSDLNLLFLGSRAYGPLRRALTGGVSARVMREAHCPVLTIPRGTVSERSPAAPRAAVADRGRAQPSVIGSSESSMGPLSFSRERT